MSLAGSGTSSKIFVLSRHQSARTRTRWMDNRTGVATAGRSGMRARPAGLGKVRPGRRSEVTPGYGVESVTVLDWLLDSDPAIRWQALRDLADAPAEAVAAERARVATEGWGARLL